jgi:hypothetical protein
MLAGKDWKDFQSCLFSISNSICLWNFWIFEFLNTFLVNDSKRSEFSPKHLKLIILVNDSKRSKFPPRHHKKFQRLLKKFFYRPQPGIFMGHPIYIYNLLLMKLFEKFRSMIMLRQTCTFAQTTFLWSEMETIWGMTVFTKRVTGADIVLILT